MKRLFENIWGKGENANADNQHFLLFPKCFLPVGRITVGKSLLIPLLGHLFISLPSPKIDFIKHLKNLPYSFVWDGRSKIKKKVFIKNYEEGGMKMIDIKIFNISMKLKWLKNQINCKPNKCYQLEYDTRDVRKIINLGKPYSGLISKVIKTISGYTHLNHT